MNPIILLVIASVSLIILFQKKLHQSKDWHATITPLASIIGSGFLVSAPLMIAATGKLAPLVMSIFVLFAYALGGSIRFNIAFVETHHKIPFINTVEFLSRMILGIAYMISVTFYLKLLSTFLFQGIGFHHVLLEKTFTSLILLIIGITGYRKGLSMLEWLEIYSVNLKLAFIMTTLFGLLVFNYIALDNGRFYIENHPHGTFFSEMRRVFGMLIILQGFETVRYLKEDYGKKRRIRSMKYAQWISGAIYVLFVSFSLITLNHVPNINETSILEICKVISPFLPYLLLIAALMSQFSAAIADTIGGGGLLSEAFSHHMNTRQSYFLMCCIGIALTWLTNIFEIITFASQAFGIYYFMQIILTIIMKQHLHHSLASKIYYVGLASLTLLMVVFGKPIDA